MAVVIINFNYGRFLAECLDSVAAQTFDNVRVIVVDDASTDDSLDVVREWMLGERLRVEVISKVSNVGPANSYNLALAALESDDIFVCIMDADDRLPRNKLTLEVAALLAAPASTVVVYGDTSSFEVIDGFERMISIIPGRQPSSMRLDLLANGAAFAVNGALIRRSALSMLPPFDESVRVCDLPLWIGLSEVGEFQHIGAVTSEVRVHGASMRITERLASDRLKILVAASRTAEERRAIRRRGRGLLKSAIVRSAHTGRSHQMVEAGLRFAVGARDPIAVLLVVAQCGAVAVGTVRACLTKQRHRRR